MKSSVKLLLVTTLSLCLVLVFFFSLKSLSHAAGPWYVAPGGDDNNSCASPSAPCATINAAIGKANSGDTVKIAIGTYTGSIGEEIVLVNKNIIISGGWDSTFSDQTGYSTIDGNGGPRRGFTVQNGITAAIERFVVEHSSATVEAGIWGGGLLNHGVLTVDQSIFRENNAVFGGAIANFTTGSLTLSNSELAGNYANDGGAILNHNSMSVTHVNIHSNFAPDWGGGVLNFGSITISNSEITQNRALGSGAGIGNHENGIMTINHTIISANKGQGLSNFTNGNVTLEGCVISKNAGIGVGNNAGLITLNNSLVASNSGSGIENRGTTFINNSTISSNRDHGIWGQPSSTLEVNNSTIAFNSASIGGGIYNQDGNVSLKNSLLADNIASSGSDCAGDISSSGYNLIGDMIGCTVIPAAGDKFNTEAHIGRLIGQPGTPMYHPLFSNSPAIDSGNPAGCMGSIGPLLSDQRGALRVGRCDIGAYEYTIPGAPDSLVALSGTPQRAAPNSSFKLPLEAGVLDNLGSPVSNTVVMFSAPSSGPSGIFSSTGTIYTTDKTSESGVAEAGTFVANALTGSYLVTTTVVSDSKTDFFSLYNIGWYVTPAGNDNLECNSPISACASINAVLGKSGFAPGDIVFVAEGIYTGAGDEVVKLDQDVNLSGGWNVAFTNQNGMSILDGQNIRRGITISDDFLIMVERFIIQNGFADPQGGGVYNGGVLTLDHCSVISNTVTGFNAEGGGIYNGKVVNLMHTNVSDNSGHGLFSWYGKVTLIQSIFENNDGPAIRAMYSTVSIQDSTLRQNSGSGISAYSFDSLLIEGSTIIDNQGVGIETNAATTIVTESTINGNMDGGIVATSNLSLNNSTVSENSSKDEGGGIGLFQATLNLNNSTISNNKAVKKGGGIFVSGWSGSTSTLNLRSSTISANSAEYGGGIFLEGESHNISLQNTIIAGNQSGSSPDCQGALTSAGYNLIGNTSGCTITQGIGDLFNIDPRLGPLEGSPGYLPLLPGSPAINAANPTGCYDHAGNPLPTDQRGMPRFQRCDIGAYELQPLGFSTKSVFTPEVLSGEQAVFTILLNNPGQSDIYNVQVSDPIPDEITYVNGSLIASYGTAYLQDGVVHWDGVVSATSPVTISFAGISCHTLGAITNTATIRDNRESFPRAAILQVNPNHVSGRVVDERGQPIYDARISDDAGHSVTTDSQGFYTIDGLLCGTYQISASARCFEIFPTEQTVMVPPHANEVNFVGESLCMHLPIVRTPCLPLFFDDFSNSNSGWPVGDDGKVLTKYQNGEYRMLVRPTEWKALARPGFQASDYIISVNLRNPNSVKGSYGIAFGLAQDKSTFYSLEIYPDGQYGIYRNEPSGRFALSEAFSPAISQGSATNKIKVERNGSLINAYANGQWLASVTDNTYTDSRYLGLVVFSDKKPDVDIRFDDFSVYLPWCGTGSSTSEELYGLSSQSEQSSLLDNIWEGSYIPSFAIQQDFIGLIKFLLTVLHLTSSPLE